MGDTPADEDAFERWYRVEHPRILAALTVATGSREVAQDLTGEAFARALEHWSRVATMESPGGWVRQVATNLLRRRQRRAAFEARLLRRTSVETVHWAPEVVDSRVWSALASLPPRQRSVVALRVVLDLSQDETAELLHIKPGTVSATLVAARRSLAESLADHAPSRSDSANRSDGAEVTHG